MKNKTQAGATWCVF